MELHEWKASVRIKGPVSFRGRVIIDGVEIRSRSNDLIANCTIQALNPGDVRDIAIRKISDVLDIVSFLSNQHLEIEGALSLQSEGKGSIDLPASFTIRRFLNENDMQKIDSYNNILVNAQTTDYGRALSYYRKGLGSVDPFDSFVSFWQAIEIVIHKFPGRHIRNKIENFYSTLQLDVPLEFDEYRQMRNNIVHGNKPRDIGQIRGVSKNIEGIKQLASFVLQQIFDNVSIRQIVM